MPTHREIPDLIGRTLSCYGVLDRLGKGGMGEVYLAEDQRLSRQVALKVLLPDLALEPRHLERFRREARSAAALNHPNIVTIHSVEEAEGLHFLVLELVEGETLADLIASGPLPLDRLLAIALPLTDALEAAHTRGVIHRDLKPRNVMVSRDGRIKVLDFGIARLIEAENDTNATLTRAGGVIGTTAYMSPEQIQGLPVEHRSDLFSLGVILYEMATWQRPFRGTSHLVTMASILHDIPQAPSALVPELPERFDEIVLQCLAKNPSQRPGSSMELRQDLRELADLVARDEENRDLERTLVDVPGAAPPLLTRRESSSSGGQSTTSRLPARPRCFGREPEIRELAGAICAQPPTPVPVLGPAGAGKTTITLAALHDSQVAQRYEKRRWFVRCDGATGRDSLVGAIARVICPEAAPPLEPSVFFKLEESPAVLALDNLETPWEQDTAAVEDLLVELEAIPALALVVALRGEQRPFGPSWREAIHAGPLDLESASSAFLSIAGERFRNDPDLDPLLGALDGLALAIALLASQAEGEPDLSTLRKRWQDQKTALLRRTGARERLHSFEVSLGLSMDSPRMTDEGRRLLSILGLLPEGVAWEDLDALLSHQGNEAASVLRKIGLAFDQGSRLRVLSPIRDYLQKNYLPQTEDLARTIDHYLALAKLGEKIGARGGAEAAQRLLPEVGNLELMILAALERTDPVPAVHAALAYSEIVRFTGLGGLGVLESARSLALQAGESVLEADCARKMGEIYIVRGRFHQAQASCTLARARYQDIQNFRGEMLCLMLLGEVHLLVSETATTTKIFEEARILAQTLGDRYGEAQCLLGLGTVADQRSDYASARDLLETARKLMNQIGNLRGEANCLMRLGHTSFDLRKLEQSQAEYESALTIFSRVGSLIGEATCLRMLGHITLRRGDANSAQFLCDTSLGLNRRVGSLLGEANCLFLLGEIKRELSSHKEAEELLQQARARFQRMGQAVGVANCCESLGLNACLQSNTLKARIWYEEALELFERVPQPVSIGRVHLKLARLWLPDSPERLKHIEAARRAWEGVNLLDQMRDELEAAEQAGTVSS